MKKVLLLLLIALAAACEKTHTACTPEMEKAIEEEGYVDSLIEKAIKSCDEGRISCQQYMTEARDAQACLSELTH